MSLVSTHSNERRKMEDIIKVCALGGLDENGRDCYVIEINNDIFVLDAGLAQTLIMSSIFLLSLL